MLSSFPGARDLLRRFAHPDLQLVLSVSSRHLLRPGSAGPDFHAACRHAAALIIPEGKGLRTGLFWFGQEIYRDPELALVAAEALSTRARYDVANALGAALLAEVLATYPGEEETCRTLRAPLVRAEELLTLLDTPERLRVFVLLHDADPLADPGALARTVCDLLAELPV